MRLNCFYFSDKFVFIKLGFSNRETKKLQLCDSDAYIFQTSFALDSAAQIVQTNKFASIRLGCWNCENNKFVLIRLGLLKLTKCIDLHLSVWSNEWICSYENLLLIVFKSHFSNCETNKFLFSIKLGCWIVK